MGTPTGSSTPARFPSVRRCLAIPDVLTLGDETLAVYLGEGDMTYASPFYIGTGPSQANILVEDLHGQSPKSGLPDIVAPDTSGGVMVLLNLTKPSAQ
jgi:hypothetical protein